MEALVRAESARLDARFVEYDKALAIRTHEIERRLDLLNGEQARLQADRERFLPRELHDAFLKEYHEWQRRVDNQLAVTTGRERGVSLVWSVGIAVIGLAIAIAGTFFAIFSRNPS